MLDAISVLGIHKPHKKFKRSGLAAMNANAFLIFEPQNGKSKCMQHLEVQQHTCIAKAMWIRVASDHGLPIN